LHGGMRVGGKATLDTGDHQDFNCSWKRESEGAVWIFVHSQRERTWRVTDLAPCGGESPGQGGGEEGAVGEAAGRGGGEEVVEKRGGCGYVRC
jgi:hypothetical protein